MKAKHKFFTIDKSKKDLVFYIAMFAFPVIQFCVFYIAVNFNSILLAFQNVDILSGQVTWAKFNNFKQVISDMLNMYTVKVATKNSIIVYILTVLISTPLNLLFSFYLYKKNFGSGLFRIFLFLPSIVSSIVMVLMYQFFVEAAVPTIYNELTGKYMAGLMENMDTRFGVVMFYNIFTGFGVTVLMYSDSMNAISPEVVESGKLDGAVGLKEFWYITLPSIWPTFTTFFVVGIAGLFTNQFNLYSFFSGYAAAEVSTLGYWMYVKTLNAAGSRADLSYLSALGLILTVITVPLVFGLRKVLSYGPSED